ncbi:MAG: chemotaxis protein CheW [Candidatus Omnitrophota bacterium]
MDYSNRWAIFRLDEHRYALHLSIVERVVRAVELTSLPKAPNIVIGLANVSGSVIPVVNIRRRFRLPERDIDPNDQMIVARTQRRIVALLADSVLEIAEYPESAIVASEKIVPGLDYVEGVIKREDGLILIHDLDRFLSLEEEKRLDEALSDLD